MRIRSTTIVATTMLGALICAGCGNGSTQPAPAQASGPASGRNVTPVAAAEAPVDPLAWPRQFKSEGTSIAVHQPQLERWDGNRLEAEAAVGITPPGKTEPTYGVIKMSARTEVDKEERMVDLSDLQITSATFPQAKAQEPAYLAMLRQHAIGKTREISLDHLEANLAATASAEAAASVEVKNDPPQVIYATSPTILVLIDGQPVLRQVQGQRIMRVFNTRPLMLLEEATGNYFLHLMNRWAVAKAPTGPWAAAVTVPPALETIKADLGKTGAVDLLTPDNPAANAPKVLPAIVVSTTPAELLQTIGEPEYVAIAGTELTYVKNTDSALFKHLTQNRFYLLISGRWFAAGALTGPWAYVPGKSLPGDFAKIPADSPRANVRLSVPGTPEAQEAVIANSIPQTASVKVAEAKVEVKYDGAPQFKPIDGAKGLSYVVNTQQPVIRVDADATCWCVDNGIWFTAAAPAGPWAVATAVPAVIYTIPVTSPLHYVTYVRVFNTSPDKSIVYVGYTPGYMGTVVSTENVVVYGTGYVYPAYVGSTVYVAYPPTYGYGAAFACGATGFAFGFVAGAAIGDCWGRPCWGPYYGYHYHGYHYANIDINSSNVYRNASGGVTRVNTKVDWETGEGGIAKRTVESVNPITGERTAAGRKINMDEDGDFIAKRGAAKFDPHSGTAVAAGGKLNMESDGDFVAKRGAASYDPETGTFKAGGIKTTGDDGDWNQTSGKLRYNTNTDSGIARKGDDIYVAKDGNVYRNDGNGWQQKTDSGWQNAERNAASAAQTRQLDTQRQARTTGQQRYQSSPSRSMSGASRGGGGMRGGGGGGRR